MDDIVDRLNGRYSIGPHLPNGEPEFGWRQFQATPINKEAADIIERLRLALAGLSASYVARSGLDWHPQESAAYIIAQEALALGRGVRREDTFTQMFDAECARRLE